MRSLNSSSESKKIQNEVAEIREALKAASEECENNLDILVVTGSNEEYLKDSYYLRLISDKVRVYFSESMRTSDMSVVLVDNQLLVIGFAKQSSKPENRSSKWVKGYSISLGSVLADHANKLKENGRGYEDYLEETVCRVMAEYQDDVDRVSKLLGLPKTEVSSAKLNGTHN